MEQLAPPIEVTQKTTIHCAKEQSPKIPMRRQSEVAKSKAPASREGRRACRWSSLLHQSKRRNQGKRVVERAKRGRSGLPLHRSTFAQSSRLGRDSRCPDRFITAGMAGAGSQLAQPVGVIRKRREEVIGSGETSARPCLGEWVVSLFGLVAGRSRRRFDWWSWQLHLQTRRLSPDPGTPSECRFEASARRANLPGLTSLSRCGDFELGDFESGA